MNDDQLHNVEPEDELRSAFAKLKTDPPEEVEQRMLGSLEGVRESIGDDAPTNAQTERRAWRPRLQFSLRAILVLMVLTSIPVYFLVRPYLSQSLAAREIERLGGRVALVPSGPPWFRERFGSGLMRDVVEIDIADSDDPSEYMDEVFLCPQLEVLVVGGDSFDDRWLAKLEGLKRLKGLVLDSTGTTAGGLEALKKRKPDLEIRHSWRRVEDALGEAAEYETGTFPDYGNLAIRVSFELPMMEYAGPDWLRGRTSDKYFKDLIFVKLTDSATDADLKHLRRLSYQALTLNGSQVTDEGLATLSALTSGQVTLNYADKPCQFSDRGLVKLLAQKAVYNLMIYGVPLGDSDLKFLQGQPKLQYLVAANTGLTDAHMPAIGELSALRELTLTGTDLTDEGLPHLAKLTSLRRLYVAETYVTREGLSAFAAKLPSCRIMWSDTGTGLHQLFAP